MYWWLDPAIDLVNCCLIHAEITEPEICKWFTTTFITTSRDTANSVEYWKECDEVKSRWTRPVALFDRRAGTNPKALEDMPKAAQIELENGGRVREPRMQDSVSPTIDRIVPFMRHKLAEGVRNFSSYSAEDMRRAAEEFNAEKRRQRRRVEQTAGTHLLYTADNGCEIVALTTPAALEAAGEDLLNCMRWNSCVYLVHLSSYIGVRENGRFHSLAEVAIADVTGDLDRPEDTGRYAWAIQHLGVSNSIPEARHYNALSAWLKSSSMGTIVPNGTLKEIKGYRNDKDGNLTLVLWRKEDNRSAYNLRRSVLFRFLRNQWSNDVRYAAPPTSIVGTYQYRARTHDPYARTTGTGLTWFTSEVDWVFLDPRADRVPNVVVHDQVPGTSAPETQRGRNTARELKHRFNSRRGFPALYQKEGWKYVPWFIPPTLIIPGASPYDAHHAFIEAHLKSRGAAYQRNAVRFLGIDTERRTAAMPLTFQGLYGQQPADLVDRTDANVDTYQQMLQSLIRFRTGLLRGTLGVMYGMTIHTDRARFE